MINGNPTLARALLKRDAGPVQVIVPPPGVSTCTYTAEDGIQLVDLGFATDPNEPNRPVGKYFQVVGFACTVQYCANGM